MGTNEIILQKVQAGIETVRGTGVAATRKVYARVAGSYDRPFQTFDDTTGTYEARRRTAYGRAKVGFTATDIATYEDLPWWGKHAWKGGVVGVTDAGSPPGYGYTFLPSLATDDLASSTFEFNEPGNPYESHQAMVNTWTLRMDTDSDDEPAWMFESEMLGLDWVPTTYTAAIADRTTEPINAVGTKVYIDGASAIGTTQVLGKLISCSITGNNAIHFKAFSENVGTYAPNKVGRGARMVDCQFVFEFDDDVEFANFRSVLPVQRKIRLLQDGGSQIHLTPTINKAMQLDLYGYWSAIAFGDREGNLTATFSLANYFDATAGGAMSAVITNALVTLP